MSQFALIGNPNTGKTSLFNILTDSYEYVGNWSGVTVEKKVGKVKKVNKEIIDLPGIYDFNPISRDEAVVTKFMLEEDVEGIINILDASQFDRNMHLTLQILEYGKPTFICLNMMDVAEKKGIQIDAVKLSEVLGVKVIPVIARTGKGCDTIFSVLKEPSSVMNKPLNIYYGPKIEKCISALEQYLTIESTAQKRWIAIQFLRRNEAVEEYLSRESYFEKMDELRKQLETELGMTGERAIYEGRKHYISKVKSQVFHQAENKTVLSEKFDKVLTHPVLGLPIFLGLMFLMFQATFAWIGTPLSDLLDGFIAGTVTDGVRNLLTTLGASGFIIDLICDGVIAGVGGVIVFIPQIFVLFFFISLLEDSGYMARIAVVMDRLMEFFGLNGKAFIPMIISFGCNVPGVMAARTIEHHKERMLTILIAPFMSCSARLPVYALFAGAFFAKNQSLVVFSLYILGIVLALVVTKILSMTILKNEKSVFFVELPAYHVPQLKTLWRSTWEKGKGFLRKAGTIIFAGSVGIWLLSYLGPNGIGAEMNESFLAKIGGVIGTLFVPIGFGTWEAGASLISGFLAKEVVVSAMAIIYGVQESALGGTMVTAFTPLSAYSFMAFVLLYMPCLATVGAIQRETRSTKWTLFATLYPFFVAYLVCLTIYQIGSLFV